jgi:hypothetical protein
MTLIIIIITIIGKIATTMIKIKDIMKRIIIRNNIQIIKTTNLATILIKNQNKTNIVISANNQAGSQDMLVKQIIDKMLIMKKEKTNELIINNQAHCLVDSLLAVDQTSYLQQLQ